MLTYRPRAREEWSIQVYDTHVTEIPPQKMINLLFAGVEHQYKSGPEQTKFIERLDAISQCIWEDLRKDSGNLITFKGSEKERGKPQRPSNHHTMRTRLCCYPQKCNSFYTDPIQHAHIAGSIQFACEI
ncbi:hypothetical protein PIIN_10841 [Serendipita indica DSM 11827]|uniref:Uncharacterized protein n=1 Tax=Serendipita indica (strain DSM 11827) TaxID=1109443 RepID=G4TZW3_SERID|nr:hypothetical protein PIIN_10841 [Serendipita indica DSM 11827]